MALRWRLATAPSISVFLDIGQGAGLAGASGVRPFLPPLLAGALARADAGIDFEGTDLSFLESPWFMLAVLAAAVGAYGAERRGRTAAAGAGPGPREAGEPPGPGGEPLPADARTDATTARTPLEQAMLALSVVLGALLFAGSLASGGETAWPGLVGGALCAALGYAALAALFARARRRLDPDAAPLFTVYADLLALAVAALSIFADPAGYLVLVALAALLMLGRREAARKYEGLRVLR